MSNKEQRISNEEGNQIHHAYIEITFSDRVSPIALAVAQGFAVRCLLLKGK